METICACGGLLLILLALYSCHGLHCESKTSVESTQGGQGLDAMCPCVRIFRMYRTFFIVYSFFFFFVVCAFGCVVLVPYSSFASRDVFPL